MIVLGKTLSDYFEIFIASRERITVEMLFIDIDECTLVTTFTIKSIVKFLFFVKCIVKFIFKYHFSIKGYIISYYIGILSHMMT